MKYIYEPEGVCSREMIFEIEGDVVTGLEVIGGCHGNLQGIAKLITGMKIDDIIAKIKGIKCGFKDTSCPDQIAIALEVYKSSK